MAFEINLNPRLSKFNLFAEPKEPIEMITESIAFGLYYFILSLSIMGLGHLILT